jgi:hydrogenase maturation factor
MPTRLGYINVDLYDEQEKIFDNVIIHTGYDINMFDKI